MPCAGPTGISMLGCCGGLAESTYLFANIYSIGFIGVGGCAFANGEVSQSFSFQVTYSPGGTATVSVVLPPVVRRITDAPTITVVDNTDPAEVGAWWALPVDSKSTVVNDRNCQTHTHRVLSQTNPGVLPARSYEGIAQCSTTLLETDKAACKRTLLAQGFGGPPFVYKNSHIMDRTGALDNGFPTASGQVFPVAGGRDISRQSIWLSNQSYQNAGTPGGLPGAFTRQTYWGFYYQPTAAYNDFLTTHKPPFAPVEIRIMWRQMKFVMYKNSAKESLCRRMNSPLSQNVFCQGGIRDDFVLVDMLCTAPYNVEEDGFIYVPSDPNKPACCNVAP